MAPERRRYVFRGRVQGVGFRATASRIARGLPVAGSVRNLADGGVELIAEGEAADLDELVGSIRRTYGPMIRDVRFEGEPPGPGPLSGFAILH